MSATTASQSGGEGCQSAKQFARQRLQQENGPIELEDVAEEYGCTPVHMKRKLRELQNEGEARRVGHSRYIGPATPDEGEESADETGPESATSVEDSVVKALKECPQEGCHFKMLSLGELRGHINASEDHQWSELEDAANDLFNKGSESSTGSGEPETENQDESGTGDEEDNQEQEQDADDLNESSPSEIGAVGVETAPTTESITEQDTRPGQEMNRPVIPTKLVIAVVALILLAGLTTWYLRRDSHKPESEKE